MSKIIKTFKSAVHAGRSIEIEERHPVGSFVRVVHEDNAAGTTVAHADAPAFCLAILEAAVGGHSAIAADLADAMSSLRREVRRVEEWAKEAADREKLQSEAWELFTAWNPDTKYGSVPVLPSFLVEEWTRIARKAREIHGGAK